MAHNTRIRPGGFWVDASVVTDAEFEALDQAQFEAINGDDGGTWAPLSQIVLGGAGLRVTGPSRLDDAIRIDVSGNLNLGSSSLLEQVAGGTSVFYGAVQIKDAAASIEVLGGAALSIDSTAAPSVVESELRMESGADVRLGANSEVKTATARGNLIPLPLNLRSRFETGGLGAAATFPLHWGYANSSGSYPGMPTQGISTGTPEWIAFEVPPIPSTATIVGFGINIDPANGHVGLPATMPQARLVRYDSNGGRTVVHTLTDTSASAAAYDAAHNINIVSGLTELVDGRWYVVEVLGEYGTNALDLLVLRHAFVAYTTTRVNHQHFETTLA